MGGWTVRPTTPDDVPAVHALHEQEHQRLVGRAFPLPLETMTHMYAGPAWDRELDLTTVELDGVLVACGTVIATPPYSEVLVYVGFAGSLGPDRVASALALLVDRGDQAARSRLGDADLEGHELAIEALQANDVLGGALRSMGFEVGRRTYTMEMSLAPGFPRPTWPEGVTLRPWDRERDLDDVIDVLSAAFADHHGDSVIERDRVEHMLASDGIRHELTFIACDVDGPVGAVFAHDRPDHGLITSLGVLRRARGRGVAGTLLLESLAGFAATGTTLVCLDVDADSVTGATRLCEGVGMHPAVVHDLWLRPLSH